MTWRLLFQALLLVILVVISDLLLSFLLSQLIKLYPAEDLARDPGKFEALILLISFLTRGFFITLSIWLAGLLFDRRRFSEFGLKLNPGWWRNFWFGAGLGAVLITLIFLLEWSAGWVQPRAFFVSDFADLPFLVALLIPLGIFVCVGVYEELFSRGYQLTNLAEGLSGAALTPSLALILATVISSAFFGLLHALNPNATLLSTLNITLAGIFLATGYLLTGDLAIPIGLHISWNFFQGNVFGFPVSGASFRFASLIQIQQSGPAWVTGGTFGPEGGLIGTISSLIGILLIMLWGKRQTGTYALHTPISAPPLPRPNPRKSAPSLAVQSSNLGRGLQHIIWDWNGTLLDDLNLCLACINGLLIKRGLDPVNRSTYLDIFGFPVKDYYQKLRFDFSKETFEAISTEFMACYEAGRGDCSLMDGAIELLETLKVRGISQSILSASKISYLEKAVSDYHIKDYFNLVDGLDNHHAAGKLSLARTHLEKLALPQESILLIGDTLHDAEIAHELGLQCCVIPNGHHSRQRLEKSPAFLVNSLGDLLDFIVSEIKQN
jgi:phosphoglycolate phosphatase-like HAD superfamily hydrolase/membrane protease YdiL (CAAX protease family)